MSSSRLYWLFLNESRSRVAHACVVKAAGLSEQDICGILVDIPFFKFSCWDLTFLTHTLDKADRCCYKYNETCSIRRGVVYAVPPIGSTWAWISPLFYFLFFCLAGREFVYTVCPTSHSEGVREGTKECDRFFLKWITSLFGAAQALGLTKVRNEAWQIFKQPANPEVTQTQHRDGNDSVFHNARSVFQFCLFHPHLTCEITIDHSIRPGLELKSF